METVFAVLLIRVGMSCIYSMSLLTNYYKVETGVYMHIIFFIWTLLTNLLGFFVSDSNFQARPKSPGKSLGIFVPCWKESVCPGGSTEVFISAPSEAKREEIPQLKYGHFEPLQD